MCTKKKLNQCKKSTILCVYGYIRQKYSYIPLELHYLIALYYNPDWENIKTSNQKSLWHISSDKKSALLSKYCNCKDNKYNSIICHNVIKMGKCQWKIIILNITTTMHIGIVSLKSNDIEKFDIGKIIPKRKNNYYLLNNLGVGLIKEGKEIECFGNLTPDFRTGDQILIRLDLNNNKISFAVNNVTLRPSMDIKKYNSNGYSLFFGIFDEGDGIEIAEFCWL